MLTLGIDCHKKFSQVAVNNAQGKFTMDAKVSNNKEIFSQFINDLNEPCEAVIEAGYSWGTMYDLLTELGVDVTVAHPLKVKAIASAKIKTDKIDARILAQLLHADLIPKIYIPTKDIRNQRNIVRQRCWLVKFRTMLKNKIHQILARNHIEDPGFSDLFSKGGRKFLNSLTLPLPDRDILKQNLTILDCINEHIKCTTQWIHDSLHDNHYRTIILSLPGFGDILSALAALEIADIDRFPFPGKFSAYSGLVPSTYATGSKVYHGNLIPHCNRWLRYAFIEASWGAITSSPYFRSFYTRLKKRKGSNTAIVAVARRLSEITYRCLKENRNYEERIYKPTYRKYAV